MARSESIQKLVSALGKARAAMAPVVKDATNPAFKTADRRDGSAYATLAAVLDACEPALRQNGLSVIQTPQWADGALTLETLLAHDSGEWVLSVYPIIADLSRPQLIGSAVTYGRRYSYMSVVGVAPEDDDGNAASGRGANGHTNGAPAPKPESIRERNARLNVERRGGPACLQPGYDHSSRGPDANGHAASGAAATAATAPAAAAMTRPDLRRWAREIEATNGPGVAAHIAAHAKKLGWPTVQWTPEQVESAYRDAMAWLEDDEPQGDVGDDGRYDDRE